MENTTSSNACLLFKWMCEGRSINLLGYVIVSRYTIYGDRMEIGMRWQADVKKD